MPLFFLILAALYLIGNGYLSQELGNITYVPAYLEMDFLCRLLGRNLLFLLYFRTSGVTRLQSFTTYIILYRNGLAHIYVIHGFIPFVNRSTSSFQHLFQPPVHNLFYSGYLIINRWIYSLFTSQEGSYQPRY